MVLFTSARNGQQRGRDHGRAGHGDDVAERAARPAHREPPRDVHAIKDRTPRAPGSDLDDFFATRRPSFTPPLWPGSTLEADQPLGEWRGSMDVVVVAVVVALAALSFVWLGFVEKA